MNPEQSITGTMSPGGIGIIIAIGMTGTGISASITILRHLLITITLIINGGMMALLGEMMTAPIIPNQTRVGNRHF